MTPHQIKLVQTSFEQLAPNAERAAEMFYCRLFELDSSLRSLFQGDQKEQQTKLMQMMTVAVKGLSCPDSLVPALQDLGRRHAGYGVQDAHYNTVGAALLWTLKRSLGDALTLEVEEAWVAVYVLIATTMKRAARELEA